MRVDSYTSVDGKLWDDFVSSSPYGHYMQSHAWGDFRGIMAGHPITLRFGTGMQ